MKFPAHTQTLQVRIRFRFNSHTWEGHEAHATVVDALIRKPYPIQVLTGCTPFAPVGHPVYDICKGEFILDLGDVSSGIFEKEAEKKLLEAGWVKVVPDATQPLPGIDA